MSDKFELLKCDNEDVISFNGNLLKFSAFKEDIIGTLTRKLSDLTTKRYEASNKNGFLEERLDSFISTPFGKCNLTMDLSSPRDGEPCEILGLGSHQWQKGKLRFNAFIEIPIAKNQQRNHSNIEFTLEFAPDTPESPLDELRKMINNEKNTAN